MNPARIKKIFKISGALFLFLTAVLAIHIYVVTRPRIDTSTRVMARIDINKPITEQDADKITAWLYRQKGVDHVLCNAKTEMVVFTYSPLKANGNKIAEKFSANLHYANAKRFLPSEEQLKGSCPVASSFTYKAYNYLKHLF
jgi:hypothetical protein